MENSEIDLGDDLLVGDRAIAKARRETERRTYHLLETKQLPGFKLGGRWYLRPSSYRAHLARLEAGDTIA